MDWGNGMPYMTQVTSASMWMRPYDQWFHHNLHLMEGRGVGKALYLSWTEGPKGGEGWRWGETLGMRKNTEITWYNLSKMPWLVKGRNMTSEYLWFGDSVYIFGSFSSSDLLVYLHSLVSFFFLFFLMFCEHSCIVFVYQSFVNINDLNISCHL